MWLNNSIVMEPFAAQSTRWNPSYKTEWLIDEPEAITFCSCYWRCFTLSLLRSQLSLLCEVSAEYPLSPSGTYYQCYYYPCAFHLPWFFSLQCSMCTQWRLNTQRSRWFRNYCSRTITLKFAPLLYWWPAVGESKSACLNLRKVTERVRLINFFFEITA